MKYKAEIKVYTVNYEGETLHIIVKINYLNILKQVARQVKGFDYNKVILSILNSVPKQFEQNLREKKLNKTEKLLLEELKNEDIKSEHSTLNIVTLRSKTSIPPIYNINNNVEDAQRQDTLLPRRGSNYLLTTSNIDTYSSSNIKYRENDLKRRNVVEKFADADKKLKRYKNGLKKIDDIGKGKRVHRWNANDFLDYMRVRFKEAYGTDSFELAKSYDDEYKQKKSKSWSVIKYSLIETFKKFGLTLEDLKDYIDWVYKVKSDNVGFPITLMFLKSEGLITEWLATKSKGEGIQSIRKKIRKGLK